jgi:hypothetical protein
MSAITRDHGDSCGPLPASLSQTPTPIDVLLKTKARSQFDRTVTERSKLFFPFFNGPIWAQFQRRFLVSAVRSAEGRNTAASSAFIQCCSIAVFSKRINSEIGQKEGMLWISRPMGVTNSPHTEAFFRADQSIP